MGARVPALILHLVASAWGHGMVMSPPGRNVMWRFGYSNPINYNDNELYCGGFSVMWDKNKGECGVCGDDAGNEQPREHEAGGKFGKGIVGARYTMGSTIEVEIDLTTNHWGYFELKLCPTNHKNLIATQECFDKYPLMLADDPTNPYFYVPLDSKKKDNFQYKVNLPRGVTCSQCVMQWTYHTGNTWGTCKNGTEAMGCGDHEIFRNCADVEIISLFGAIPPNFITYSHNLGKDAGQFIKKPLLVKAQVCVSRQNTTLGYSLGGNSNIQFYKQLDDWCQINCLSYPPNCPPEKCACLDECEAVGDLRGIPGTDVFCHRNCLRYPSNCPRDKCRCTIMESEGSGVIQSEK